MTDDSLAAELHRLADTLDVHREAELVAASSIGILKRFTPREWQAAAEEAGADFDQPEGVNPLADLVRAMIGEFAAWTDWQQDQHLDNAERLGAKAALVRKIRTSDFLAFLESQIAIQESRIAAVEAHLDLFLQAADTVLKSKQQVREYAKAVIADADVDADDPEAEGIRGFFAQFDAHLDVPAEMHLLAAEGSRKQLSAERAALANLKRLRDQPAG